MIMILHTLTLTYRSFVRSKTTFFINLAGLSIALSVSTDRQRFISEIVTYRINEGDTMGRKYPIRTSGIRVLVSKDGIADSSYVAINYLGCPLHLGAGKNI